jgi:chromosome segregation ATPase
MDDMTDLSELEQRLTAAIGRMRAAHQATRSALAAARARIAELEAAAETASGEDSVTAAALDEAGAEIARLRAALDAERGQAAEIAEAAAADQAARDATLKEVAALRAAGRLGQLRDGTDEGAVTRQTELEQALDRLRAVNAQLRQNNTALRRAHADGLADPELVNTGLQLEIDALSAARAADRAEIDSILAALKPIVEETEDA